VNFLTAPASPEELRIFLFAQFPQLARAVLSLGALNSEAGVSFLEKRCF